MISSRKHIAKLLSDRETISHVYNNCLNTKNNATVSLNTIPEFNDNYLWIPEPSDNVVPGLQTYTYIHMYMDINRSLLDRILRRRGAGQRSHEQRGGRAGGRAWGNGLLFMIMCLLLNMFGARAWGDVFLLFIVSVLILYYWLVVWSNLFRRA